MKASLTVFSRVLLVRALYQIFDQKQKQC